MEKDILAIGKEYLTRISEAASLVELDEIYLALFGTKGAITVLPKQFSTLPKDELQKVGPLFNQTKTTLEKIVNKRRDEIRENSYKGLKKEMLNLEKVEVQLRKGHLHPVTEFEHQIEDLFKKIGFQCFDAPYIDSDYNNFEVLNMPENHPARDLWDTLYISNDNLHKSSGKLLLRTHTSNSQIHIMKNFSPPFRMMNIGRCFRYENLDARHEHTFEQFEIVYVDKGLSMANLQYLSEYFLKAIFGSEIRVRLKPKYYPFVEPGAGVDGLCIFCKGKGCKICSLTGWLELAGAGMIHPQVLRNGGVDPEKYSGIAWGFGPFRILMLKHGIEDIRLFLKGDLSFLQKF